MKPLNIIRNLPISRKLTVLILVPCLIVLVTAGGALLWFQLRMFRLDFTRDMHIAADIVSANSVGAISFRDQTAAMETLMSLRAREHIVSAVLVLNDRSVFARFGRLTNAPVVRAYSDFHFDGNLALLEKPILMDGKQIATLNLVSDYRAVYDGLFNLVTWVLTILVGIALAVAFPLSNFLQRLISDPVMRLARTAEKVADNNDYSIRAGDEAGRELRILTRTFNKMLMRIQEQDEAITLSQHKLQALIESIDGIVWECDPVDFHFSYVSRQSERILGYLPGQWTGNPRFWHEHLLPEDAPRAVEICRDYASRAEPYSYEYRMLAADGRVVWIRESGSVLVEHGQAVAMRGIFLDITAQRNGAEELERLNRRLLETSRLAGMAEVATGVLHNVGNVLNSVSVSAALVTDRLKKSKLKNLCRATAMLRDQNGGLVDFLTRDPKGKVLPEYLSAVSTELSGEQSEILHETQTLNQNIEHIKEIVAMQQSYARVSGAYESLDAVDLVEDALRMNLAAFDRHRIEVVREYAPALPQVNVDRHKVLQILINLMRNAKYALDSGPSQVKHLTIGVAPGLNGTVAISVRDNGVGIASENLTRIFGHGFTTKKDGHGFGLHSGANAAREMGGRLIGLSDGLGHGAEFILELPVTKKPELTTTA